MGKQFNIPFRRNIMGNLLMQWQEVIDYVNSIRCCVDEDKVSWSLNKNGVFSTKSMYNFLEKDLSGSSYSWIWKTKIPLKIQIFVWQLFQNAVVTRDNMKKRNWPGSPVCSFCDVVETANHLFFECSVSRVVWGTVGGCSWH